MKCSIWQARYFRSTGRKVVMALAFASLINGLSISPALAAKDDGRGQGARQGDHGQRASRGDRERHDQRHDHRRPYNYAQPVYVPPPVYYEPQQSPGISLFFPLDFRR
jgi:hypothetical protein